MNKTVVFSFIILTCLVNISICDAYPTVTIKIGDFDGNMLSFSYIISSDTTEVLKIYPSLSCERGLESIIRPETVEVSPEMIHRGEYSTGNTDHVYSGLCVASVFVGEPYDISHTEEFYLDEKETIEFTLDICADESCYEKSAVFLNGEDIFIDYESSQTDLTVTGKITKPDGTQIDIELPETFEVDQIGKYEIHTIGEKEGYDSVTKDNVFSVLESDISLEYHLVSEISDLKHGDDVNNGLAILIFTVVLIIIVAGIVLFFFSKYRKPSTPEGYNEKGYI